MSETYCCAYWDFLRGKTALEPIPAQYGLSWESADVLKRQCEAHWKQVNP